MSSQLTCWTFSASITHHSIITCLFWAKKKYDEVIALSFNYGQRHSKELECAKKICKEHGVEHHILDMGLLNQLAPNSLTRVDMEVDHEAPEKACCAVLSTAEYNNGLIWFCHFTFLLFLFSCLHHEMPF